MVPAQMWGPSRRRCGARPGADVGAARNCERKEVPTIRVIRAARRTGAGVGPYMGSASLWRWSARRSREEEARASGGCVELRLHRWLCHSQRHEVLRLRLRNRQRRRPRPKAARIELAHARVCRACVRACRACVQCGLPSGEGATSPDTRPGGHAGACCMPRAALRVLHAPTPAGPRRG